MRFLRRIACFIKGHAEPEYLRKLNILAKIRCPYCESVYCLNRETNGIMRWKLSWDYEFDKMESHRNWKQP